MTAVIIPQAVRDWRRQRREADLRITRLAMAEVVADEQAMTGPRRRGLSLGAAGRRFWSHPSPFILAGSLLVVVIARLVIGDYQATDLVVPVVVAIAFPVVEWLIHVFILHFKPVTVGRVRIDPLLAREHRAHHADPRDLPLVFIPWQTFTWLLPILAVVGVVAFPRLALGLTFLVTLTAFGLAYEWTHYLIHSDYRPVTAAYRAVWRNHRLHHYKNERYWFSVTTSGTSDRLFGTYPDPTTVASSDTAKDLHGLNH